MSRKLNKGNSYNHRINENKMGRKRKRSMFNIKVQGERTQLPLFHSSPICSMCGKEFVGEAREQDGKLFCDLCLMIWNG